MKDSPAPSAIASIAGGSDDGPLVLLLHGVTRRAVDLASVYEALPEPWGWQAIDLPGHGDSARLTGDYRVIDYLEAIADRLRNIRRRPLVLLGHSLGAMLAAAAAARWPERIAGLVLEDPPFSTMGSRIELSVYNRQFVGLSELLAQPHDNWEALYHRLRQLPVCRPDNRAIVPFSQLRDDPSLQTYAQYLTNVDLAVLAPIVQGRWLEGYDLPGIARGIQCPALLLQADPACGGMLTDDEAVLFSQQARDCQLKYVAGAGHMIHASHPEWFMQQVHAFLAGLVNSTAEPSCQAIIAAERRDSRPSSTNSGAS